jgi:hypothetical protein
MTTTSKSYADYVVFVESKAKNNDPSLWEPVHPQATQTTPDALELLRE